MEVTFVQSLVLGLMMTLAHIGFVILSFKWKWMYLISLIPVAFISFVLYLYADGRGALETGSTAVTILVMILFPLFFIVITTGSLAWRITATRE